jgi:hypothetical protein
MQKILISPKMDFVFEILFVSAGLVVFANFLASGFNLRFGLVLAILGILSMGIGNILSLPNRRYERYNGTRPFNIFKLPSPEEYIAGKLFIARHAASFYSIENALLLAGFVILLGGLFILF